MIVREARPVPKNLLSAGKLAEAGFELQLGTAWRFLVRGRERVEVISLNSTFFFFSAAITPKSSLDSRVRAHVERAERDADAAELEALPEVVVTPPTAVDRATSVPSLPRSAPGDVLKERLEALKAPYHGDKAPSGPGSSAWTYVLLITRAGWSFGCVETWWTRPPRTCQSC